MISCIKGAAYFMTQDKPTVLIIEIKIYAQKKAKFKEFGFFNVTQLF